MPRLARIWVTHRPRDPQPQWELELSSRMAARVVVLALWDYGPCQVIPAMLLKDASRTFRDTNGMFSLERIQVIAWPRTWPSAWRWFQLETQKPCPFWCCEEHELCLTPRPCLWKCDEEEENSVTGEVNFEGTQYTVYPTKAASNHCGWDDHNDEC